MPRPIDDQIFVDMQFPLHGLDVSKAFDEQMTLPMQDGRPAGTTRLGVNVRGYESITGRARGGTRPGLQKYPPGQVPGTATPGVQGLIQHLNIIVDPAATALGAAFDPLDDGFGGGGVVDISSSSMTTFPFGLRNGDGSSSIGDPSGARFVRSGGSGIQPNRNVRSLHRLTPVITWANPADIDVGTALSGTQLNATAKDPLTNLPVTGTFTYTPASGVVLPKGQGEALFTQFVPSLVASYTSPTKTVHINVVTRRPVITWANPADITHGTALSATQLNATAADPVTSASIAGTFNYTPPSGTVLNAGSGQTLSTYFVPTNQGTYQNGSASATINVTSPPIAFVQRKETTNDYDYGSPQTQTLAFDSNVTAGNLILVAISVSQTTNVVNGPTALPPVTNGVTDSQGNTYTRATADQSASWTTLGQTMYNLASLWYAIASTTGPCTVTAHAPLTDTNPYTNLIGVCVLEYSGINAGSPLDVASGTTMATPTNVTTAGPITVATTGNLLLSMNATSSVIDDPLGSATFTPSGVVKRSDTVLYPSAGEKSSYTNLLELVPATSGSNTIKMAGGSLGSSGTSAIQAIIIASFKKA